MSLVNLAICDFVSELLDEKVPSDEVIKAFKEAVAAEPAPDNMEGFESIIPSRLVKSVYPIYQAGPVTDVLRNRVEQTLEKINLLVGTINVPFFMAYFEASKLHSDTFIKAEEKIVAFEMCLTFGEIGNAFYEAEIYNRLAALYLDDAVGNIAKIKVLTPKLRLAMQKKDAIPSSFLG